MQTLEFIDSHTGGEPTRVVLSGGPDLGDGPLSIRLDVMRSRFDCWRSGVVNEPRGSDVIVGALLCEPEDPTCTAGVIFFNNVGYLGMCGHGTIGLVVSLADRGRIDVGRHRIETPVGIVEAELNADGSVSVENVPAYRHKRAVSVMLPEQRALRGDIAWGGNWFFLVSEHGQRLDADNIDELTGFAWAIRQALEEQKITGADGAVIDHIELFSESPRHNVDSRNFVLCPGKAYDRSPCGTGTSAKVACLAADGVLGEGETWHQESIVGSVFQASYRRCGDLVVPRITGRAFVTAEGTLRFDDDDPFAWGI